MPARIRTSFRSPCWIWSGMAAFVAAAVGLTLLGGCPADGEPGANEVLIRNITFDPDMITITAGTTVRWTNRDIVPHTVTSGNPGDADIGSVFRSGILGLGETFSHTFTSPGTFVYFCEVHPVTMRGATVIVEQQP